MCANSGMVKECIKCYGEAAKDNKEVSSVCPGLVCGNFTLLREDPSQDNYDVPGTVDSSTIDCFLIDGECHYSYYVGLLTNGESVYAVSPRECLLVSFWPMALIIMFSSTLIGFILLMIIKCCIIYLDYRKFKMKRSEEDFSMTVNPLYDNLVIYANATNLKK